MLSIVCQFLALLLFARIVSVSFSSKIRSQVREHWLVHAAWGTFGVLGALVFLGILNPRDWPPPWVERRGQREKVLQRVKKSGGWEAIRRGSEELTAIYTNGLIWSPPGRISYIYEAPVAGSQNLGLTITNYAPLPPAIAALQPKEVRYFPSKIFGNPNDPAPIEVVCIKMYGAHASGGFSIPYFGLEVPCGKGAEFYKPLTGQEGVPGNRHFGFREVAPGVFEVY